MEALACLGCRLARAARRARRVLTTPPCFLPKINIKIQCRDRDPPSNAHDIKTAVVRFACHLKRAELLSLIVLAWGLTGCELAHRGKCRAIQHPSSRFTSSVRTRKG